MKLTEKQKRFADEYIRCGNATQAARIADYKNPEASAKDNLRKPTIKTYIDSVLERLESERIMDVKEALQILTVMGRGEVIREHERKVFDEELNDFRTVNIEFVPDIDQQFKALQELLKRLTAGNKDALQEKLLQAQINKLMAETKNEETGARTIIVTGEEEMRRVLNERSNKHH